MTPQRLARATAGYFLGTEKAVERYTTRRNLFMQSIAQVVGDQDKRFNETELKLLDEALPRLFTRKSTAKDAFNVMRSQVRVKFSSVAPSTSAPPPTQGQQTLPLDDAAQQARERAQQRFVPGATP